MTSPPVPLTSAPSSVSSLFQPVTGGPSSGQGGPTAVSSSVPGFPSAVEQARRPYPQINGFRPWIINELGDRKIELPHAPVAPFVRMTSGKQDLTNGYIFFSLGLHGLEVPIANVGAGTTAFDPRNVASNGLITEASNINIFDLSYGGGSDVVGYARDLTNPNSDGTYPIKMITTAMLGINPSPDLDQAWINSVKQVRNQTIGKIFADGAHPVPGILELDNALRTWGPWSETSVTFKCYNRAQFEYLRNQFLIQGGSVIVEWGNIWSSLTPVKMLNFSDVTGVRQIIANAYKFGAQYVYDQFSQANSGNYMFMVGNVYDYTVTIDHSGMYIVQVKITGVGELALGLNNYATYVNKTAPLPDSGDPNGPNAELTTTIHDYFKMGGVYDLQMGLTQADPNSTGLVARYYNDFGKNYLKPQTNPNITPPFVGVSTNYLDTRWVSWKFLTINVLQGIYNMVVGTSTKSTEKTTSVLQTFLGLEDDADPTSLAQANLQDWIGDMKYLYSTNPDVMLIMRQSTAKELQAQGVLGLADNGYFDGQPYANGYRGKLKTGIWLNSEMIREAFLTSNTLVQAFRAILERMNDASGNYWKLRLIYDVEHARYKVIDDGHKDFPKDQTLYMFNHGTLGECLDISLNASWPKEIATTLALTNIAGFTSQPDTTTLQNQAPAVGVTSPFALALNWTSLYDQVEADFNAIEAGQTLSPLQARMVTPKKGSSTGDATDNRQIAKLADDRGAVGQSSMVSFTSPGAAQPMGQMNIAPIPPFQADAVVETRNSPLPVSNPQTSALVANSYQYSDMINAAATKYNVPPQLIKAVIANESNFDPSAQRYEANIQESSMGLMQILPTTAEGYGFSGQQSDLSDPATNINYGTAYLADLYHNKCNEDPEATLSAYNGGYRPGIGFGGPAQTSNFVCLAGRDVYGNCLAPQGSRLNPWVPAGTYANRSYVNNGMKNYNTFLAADGQPPVSPMNYPVPNTTLPTSTGDPATDAADENNQTNQQSADQQQLADWAQRYGNIIIRLIKVSRSGLLAAGTADGYQNHRAGIPNNFVAPFPLETTVEVEMAGIAGISIGDGFHVDKLPFVFEQCGQWQVTEIVDTVTPERGWITRIKGWFTFCYLDGDGMTNPGYTKPVTGPSNYTAVRRQT